jgi:hypothetical protein
MDCNPHGHISNEYPNITIFVRRGNMNHKIIIVLTLFLASLLLLTNVLYQRPLPTHEHPQRTNPTSLNKQVPKIPQPKDDKEIDYLWGVDSASAVDESFYKCITSNYGSPVAFGRYLGTKEGVSFGLTSEEFKFLQNEGIKIIPIYNHFTDATTYEKGVQEAAVAISLAKELGIPEGVYIFADIEPDYPVDSKFILGWYDTISKSPYSPGIYGVFSNEQELTVAYKEVISSNENLQDELITWHSGSPLIGVTSEEEAPTFSPEVPEFVSVSIWQYGIDGDQCNIDTNLINPTLINQLW